MLLLSIGREAYKKILEAFQRQKQAENLEFLGSSGVFRSWDSSALTVLLYDLQALVFKRGQTVYRQDDAVDAIYVVKEGEVEVRADTRSVRSGNASTGSWPRTASVT